MAKASKELLAWTIYYTFQIAHEQFMVKSRGGVDNVGIRWKPLSPRTIAYRPMSTGESRNFGVRNYTKTRGLLTPSQDKRWKAIYFYQTRRGKSPAEAASLAWSIVKRDGAKTRIGLLGRRVVPIMIVTHRLEKSLRPGRVVAGEYIPTNEQWFNIRNGELTIGSYVPYEDHLSQKRPIFPENITPWVRQAKLLAKRKLGIR